MKPGGERRLTAELAQLDAELGQGLLGGVSRVLRVTEHVAGEAIHPGGVTLAQRLQGSRVTVLRTFYEDRVAESAIGKLGLRPKRSPDSTA